MRDFFLSVCKGDEGAADFLEIVAKYVRMWDNLVDQDAPVSPDQANDACYGVLIDLPLNPFYIRHFNSLQPLITQSVLDWRMSNRLVSGNAHDKTIAFVLRDTINSLLVHCAYLIGGRQWVDEIHPHIIACMYTETLEEYLRS